MIALAAVLLMSAASVGWGAGVLRFLGVRTLSPVEHTAWSFTLGVGTLGWIGFVLALGGLLATGWLASACVAGLIGLVWWPRPRWAAGIRQTPWTWLLFVVIGGLVIGDVIEALAPPSDADSLAYHFATPRLFLDAGRLFFIPRASDGAAPLLQQMTYLIAMGLGGERALTLWTMIGGWGIGLLIYAACRRWLPVTWSLAAAITFVSIPAMLYSGGTGQVEPRNAMFVLVGALAVAEARRGQQLRFALVAGLCAGFFMASKYPGLIFAAAAGLTLLFQRRGWLAGIGFGGAAVVAGFQWYGWNWWNTGDPVFPLLYGLVDYSPAMPWNAAQSEYMRRNFVEAESLVPRNLLWLLLYPLRILVDSHPIFEAGRTGFGPLPLLLLPFAVVGVWLHRHRGLTSLLLVTAVIGAIAYVLWFFLGVSQRVRHLLPLLPLLWIPLFVAAYHSGWRQPLAGAIAVTLLIQFAGALVFYRVFAEHLLRREAREEFLLRTVSGYGAVTWINQNLAATDKVLVTMRQLNFFFDVPYFYAHSQVQAVVETRPDSTDPAVFWHQLRQAGITHMLTEALQPGAIGAVRLGDELRRNGCLTLVQTFQDRALGSRSLSHLAVYERELLLSRLNPVSCPLEAK